MASEPIPHFPHFETPSLANQQFAPASGPACASKDGDSWDRIIDHVMVEWRRCPQPLEDEGIDAPTEAAMNAATQAACLLRDQQAPIPSNVSPTGDGGIALHYEHSDVLFTIEFDSSGHRELRFHFGGQLVRLGEWAAS